MAPSSKEPAEMAGFSWGSLEKSHEPGVPTSKTQISTFGFPMAGFSLHQQPGVPTLKTYDSMAPVVVSRGFSQEPCAYFTDGKAKAWKMERTE